MKNIENMETIIILDWDDTLFPTQWVIKNNINMNNIESRNRYHDFFRTLDQSLYKFLNKCTQLGTVIIVTNAMPIWIKNSSAVLENTKIILSKIPIISARKEYQYKTKSMMDWKKQSFNKILESQQDKKELNIISIGDADFEYQALINLYDQHPKVKKILKSVKLIREPSYETLVDELDVLNEGIYKITLEKKHMDLNFDYSKIISR